MPSFHALRRPPGSISNITPWVEYVEALETELRKAQEREEQLREALRQIDEHEVVRSPYHTEIAMRMVAREALRTI